MLTFFIACSFAFGLILPLVFWKIKSCKRLPKATVTLYLDDLDCFEPLFDKAVRLRECADLCLTVVDLVNSPQSRAWLLKLREKSDFYFDVVSEKGDDNGESNGNYTRKR